MQNLCIFAFLFIMESTTYAGNSINFYQVMASALSLPHYAGSIIASLFITLLLISVGFFFRRYVFGKIATDGFPIEKFKIHSFLELVMDFVLNLAKDQCGSGYLTHLPLLAAIFLFVLASNLTGLVPGLVPPTELFSFNLAMGSVVFFAYNYAGFSEHGIGYLKHFTGPFLLMAPFFIVLETISHLARPLSLSFRLAANIFGDHLLLGVFSHMVPVGVPALLLCFGLLVAFIQSFVFTVLTSIYIGIAVSHDH